jgi:Acyl-CoA dehydrogenase, middle domain/Acyl-CoA dehydrogenase, N-terminal domain/Acyl-CoA dehydrogenase, C-terminal domain
LPEIRISLAVGKDKGIMITFAFEPTEVPDGIPEFRGEIRQFLRAEFGHSLPEDRVNSWTTFDPVFSRKLGEQGWIGMTWPAKYGGHDRDPIERYVLLEELLAAGAPVGAHWIADRQSGPALLKYGTEGQRRKFLPGMAGGTVYCCIGMSEPNAGSDLASVRTRAERLPDGRWRISGQKIWTTNAHRCQLMVALVRTSLSEVGKHAGLSQFLIELDNPGIKIRTITDLTGRQEFCEVFFEDAIIPADSLLGVDGEGWKQCTNELSLERSGPERYMSGLAVFFELLRSSGPDPSESVKQVLGSISADIWCLRQMSLSVAGQLASGRDPSLEACIVKDLGNAFEQGLPTLVQAFAEPGVQLESAQSLSMALGRLLQIAPSFSLRGGTREIIRGIIARGLGLR